MSFTFATKVACPCCGEAVAMTVPGGFAGTTCELEACTTLAATGVASTTVPKTVGMALPAA